MQFEIFSIIIDSLQNHLLNITFFVSILFLEHVRVAFPSAFWWCLYSLERRELYYPSYGSIRAFERKTRKTRKEGRNRSSPSCRWTSSSEYCVCCTNFQDPWCSSILQFTFGRYNYRLENFLCLTNSCFWKKAVAIEIETSLLFWIIDFVI